MRAPLIDVLLATYNGARYLREQMNSALAQRDVSLRIMAHDDGSTDVTIDILHEFAARYPQQVQVLQDGVRTGSAKNNFAYLLRACSAGYAAFCDQDDVWLPEKLSVSMAAMNVLEARHGADTPLLVYTDLRVVDESLHTVSESLWQRNNLRNAVAPTFAQLLTENVVTGCTALLNRPLITRLLPMPVAAQMHDHWAALVAGAAGAMKAVPQATVLYRQHSSNVVGAVGPQPSLLAKLLRFVSAEGAADRAAQMDLDRAQAQALLELHGESMTPQSRATLAAFLRLSSQSRSNRLRTVSQYGLWRPDVQRRIAQAIDLMRP